MTEHEQTKVPYWQFDWPVGAAPLFGQPTPIVLRTHSQDELYSRQTDLYELSQRRGTRTYLHARPGIFVPHISITAQLAAFPDAAHAIGHVTEVQLGPPRYQDLGQAQAWFYPADATLILWECYLHDWCRGGQPSLDETFKAVWQGFERLLLERLPAAQRILTPSWEPIYDNVLWQDFLHQQGYTPLAPQAFVKPVLR